MPPDISETSAPRSGSKTTSMKVTDVAPVGGASMKTKWGTPDVIGIYKPLGDPCLHEHSRVFGLLRETLMLIGRGSCASLRLPVLVPRRLNSLTDRLPMAVMTT
jgi:hypothetical protein